MPKKPKSGPPYTDIPKEIYVVVINPWGMERNPRLRGQNDFDCVVSWAQLVLQQAGLGGGRIATIECIYSMGTRDEIILQFQEGTDIIPLLGEHRWANIAKDWKGHPNDPRSTRAFIYNWRNNGDPANHNWTENFPKRPRLDNIPAKSPYPAPSWIQPPTTLTNFVHSIPHPPIPPPVPNHGPNSGQEEQSVTLPPPSTVMPSPAPPEQEDQPDSGEQPVAPDSESINLFRPYEPPVQHPSHAQFLNRQQTGCDEASSSRMSPPPPKFIKKLDPYELGKIVPLFGILSIGLIPACIDEDALNVLRSPNLGQEDTKDLKNEDIKPILPLSIKAELPEVKIEDGDTQRNIPPKSGSRYQPSQALIDAFNSLPQTEQIPSSNHPPARDPRRRPNAASQTQPSASSGYQPSAELEAEINGFLLASQTQPPASSGYRPSAELEAEINGLLLGTAATTSSLALGSGARPTHGTRVTTIKREYEEDVVPSLVGERKRIKIEEY